MDLQKFRQSRAVLQYREQSARLRTFSEIQPRGTGDNHPVNGSNTLTAEENQTLAAIGTLPRAPTSPFVRKPVVKKRVDNSPIYRRRNSAVRRSSRRKKVTSAFLLSSSFEGFGDKRDASEVK